MTTSIITKYRPAKWEEVVGHQQIVESLRRVLVADSARAFLLHGPTGVGKTTIARLIAKEVGAAKHNIREIDAASNTGIDDMRAVTADLVFTGLGSPNKIIIVDECQSLSKAAWQSLLKSVEEPPEHVWWVFCTTDMHKVPDTIRTRCLVFELKPISADDLNEYLLDVVAAEKLKIGDDLVAAIARRSYGSPRRALGVLAKCDGAKTVKDVLPLFDVVEEEESGIGYLLAKNINSGNLDWLGAMKILGDDLNGESPEGIRLVVVSYLSKVIQGAKSKDSAGRLLEKLDAFIEPYNQPGNGQLLLSLGRAILS